MRTYFNRTLPRINNLQKYLLLITPLERAVDVAEVMTREVETIAPDAPLGVAASRLTGPRIGCLPVVRADGVMVGLVTETDLLAAAYLGKSEKE